MLFSEISPRNSRWRISLKKNTIIECEFYLVLFKKKRLSLSQTFLPAARASQEQSKNTLKTGSNRNPLDGKKS
jgi:hypothetical protein